MSKAMGQAQMSTEPPAYSTDVLAPPVWNGPPGQLIPWLANGMQNQKFSIFGTDSQVLQVLLHPGEALISEPGAMAYRGDSIKMQTHSDGCGVGCRRMCGGESYFRNTYTNKGSVPACIAVSPNYPAKIVPIDLGSHGTLLAAPGLYLAHYGDVNVTFQTVTSCLVCCCSGTGLFLLKLHGNGTVFILAGGTLMEKVLPDGESLIVDSDSLVGFSESAKYDVRRNGGCLTCCCGGEGLFSPVVIGPGLVMVQSMSKKKLQKELAVAANSSGGEGSTAAS